MTGHGVLERGQPLRGSQFPHGWDMSRTPTIVAHLLISLFAAAAALEGSRLPRAFSVGGLSPGILPLIVGVSVLLLALIQILAELRHAGDSEGSTVWPGWRSLRRVSLMLVSLGLYVFASESIGFFLASWVFLSAVMRMLGAYRWWIVVAGGLTGSACATAVFRVWLTMPLPNGWLGW